jgi:hypothetical protein
MPILLVMLGIVVGVAVAVTLNVAARRGDSELAERVALRKKLTDRTRPN